MNTSPGWQVRIGWCSEPPMVWPPFTYDTKDTKESAEDCARHAMMWKKSDDGLYVTVAWVREPGASEWEPVALPQAVTS